MLGATRHAVELIYGAGQLDRIVRNADELLRAFTDDGRRYLAYRPSTPPDRLVPDDLAVTILINSRVGYRAFVSVQDRGSTVDLTLLPRVSLEQASEDQRAELADFISHVAQ